MSENKPPSSTPTETGGGDPSTAAVGQGTEPTPPAQEEKVAKRYAAYNVTLGKFVGGVRDSKREAEAIAKTIRSDGHKSDVREV